VQRAHAEIVPAHGVGTPNQPASRIELEQAGRLGAGQDVRAIKDDRDGRFQAIRCQDRLADFEDQFGGQ